MFSELVGKIKEYQDKGFNFAIAQIIDRKAPSSGKIGDKALILETGELIGWIGGGCVRGIVIKEALEVIKTKRYRRVRISPEGGTSTSEYHKNYVMSCQSGGTIEVLIEPVFPQPELIVVGKSNIARKLVTLAAISDFKVTAMALGADNELFPQATEVQDKVNFDGIENFTNRYVIVTTQGEDDELSVQKALNTPAPYVGFVASERKAGQLREYLKKQGLPEDRIGELKSPVGMDINAKSASEVAISILAHIIADFRAETTKSTSCCSSKTEETTNSAFEEEYYINPVCNVPVSRKNPKHIVDYEGEKVYFCCDGCKVSFEKNPAQYMSPSEG
ncbi:XdhC family protein [Spongiimicrobium salis]|uniref:XdhC family protein n=1 Tax=Spongiimicrobium salis TaxID=1667022 RepID=UPI00374CC422